MKKKRFLAAVMLVSMCLCACRNTGTQTVESEEVQEERVVIGFSQIGAESDWRNANTKSMKDAFSKENGYELIYEDAQQKQSNQIMAIRNFIQQEVDYIILAPVTEKGWDTVLGEAKDAGIPVIILDRMVDVEDSSLYTCFVGSDFELEGKKAAAWLNSFAVSKEIEPCDLHIVNIQGTIGASAQIGRTKGLEDAAEEYGWDLLAEESGEYTRAKGREVMEEFLHTFDTINVVYCENDNEAFGAIEAIEAAGKTVGTDILNGEIMVISFDAVREGMNYALEGKITCEIECNPLHGPRVQGIVKTLEAGGTPNKISYAEEGIFSAEGCVTQVVIENQVYQVTRITEELMEQREY